MSPISSIVSLKPQNSLVFLEEQMNLKNLQIDSTLAELPLHVEEVEVSCLTKYIVKKFQEDSIIPGIILMNNGLFYGMISRRRFLERMSRPYSLDIFLKRPISSLYNAESVNLQIDILSAATPILNAARFSLRRPVETMYDPLVIRTESGHYALLDVPHLLYAQSHLHKLTNQLLQEQRHAHTMQTEKMASLGRMMAGIAHEIRNPVNCLHGNMNFLKNYVSDLFKLIALYQKEITDPPVAIAQFTQDIELDFLQQDLQKILTTLEVSAVRTANIVTNLHSFSRIDETNPQVISLAECIDGTLLILNNRIKNKIKIQTEYETDIPEVWGYSGQLSQVFMNLFVNALDALEEKLDQAWQPEIQIKITTQPTEKNQNREWVCIEVKDNADGIPEDIQAQIFQDFFTTKPVGKGTGLGLAISHEIITQKHNGKLEFISELGLGTTFLIWLPLKNNL